jgi:hypothetical protein
MPSPKVTILISAIAFVVFFSLIIAYHFDSRAALAEQVRMIARGEAEASKDAVAKDASRLSGIAVAAGFSGLVSGLSLFAWLYQRHEPTSIHHRQVEDGAQARAPSAASRTRSRGGGMLGDLVPSFA